MAETERYRLKDKPSSKLIYPQPSLLQPARRDVLVLSSWLAPVVWEGTFNIDILNNQFRLQNATIGLTAFALRRHTIYLKQFLTSAEKHFMVGHRVNYYIFTDHPPSVPHIPLHKGRKLTVFQIPGHDLWHDVSMQRMEFLSVYSNQRFHKEVSYLVCADVDISFQHDVGVEILSSLFATLHLSFYMVNRELFHYERRPSSQAYIPEDEGDFYYTGSLFGGSVAEVYRLVEACHQMIIKDKASDIEAVCYDESYLNKYLLYHKPTKILSSEYMFSEKIALERWSKSQLNLFSLIKPVKILDLAKNYTLTRGDFTE
ncbi:histo-blood group ABO system transferase 1-like [Psammomys obesus]|uniref:histo-blood group ABO system transferase 1-like n=1 Tax=Psammomys obesus TaxID=48139 RepID=UPI002452E95C|nr:histo-blood group ABO system transferase 1-like [Psammomys obesus]